MSRQSTIKTAIAVMIVVLFVTACAGTTAAPTSEPQPSTSTPAPTGESEVVSIEEPTAAPTPEPESTPTLDLPDTSGVLRVGETAPDFTLLASNGEEVSLSDELQANQYVVLVFYHSAT